MTTEKKEGKLLSRRSFITQSGIFVGGAVIAATGLSLVSCAEPEKPAETPVEWPWPYKKLDVERVRKLGHLGYYMGNCSSGAFYAILRALREEIGYPYTLLPIDPPNNMLHFGGGGVVGWGSLCGGLNGTFAAVNLISKDQKAIVDEMMGWYTGVAIPSDISNEYASNHEFLHEEFPAQFEGKYKSDKVLPQSISPSDLCHVSVTTWCKASGYASGSNERSERCARLTGDVAAHAVELLNAMANGKFVAAYVPLAETKECRGCHFKGKDFAAGQWTRGKQECLVCHEPHK